MTTRQLRRAAERAKRKFEQKQSKQTVAFEQPPGNALRDGLITTAESLPCSDQTSLGCRASEAKLSANQANAQLSTGPRTEQGKAASSQNSFKHGLYSTKLVIPGENPAELDALRSDLIAEHQPQSTTEAILVNEMAEQYWRLCRARRLEVLFLKNDAVITQIAAAQRMMTTAERGFHKALKSLTELQKARGFVPQKPAKPESGFVPQTAATPSTNDSFRAAPARSGPEPVGFVPQTPKPTAFTAPSYALPETHQSLSR